MSIAHVMLAAVLLSASDVASSDKELSVVAATPDTGRVAVKGGSLFYEASGAGDRPFRAPDDLAALLRALGVSKATLIGLSMGGGIAIDFTLAYPDMVNRLVLASSSISGGT